MISIFNPFSLENAGLIKIDSSINTPILSFNQTVESLTRDIEIKPLHSHNDYWRKQPLFDALSYGFQSIESDVWYFPKNYKVERTITETTKNGEQKTRIEKQVFRNNEIYVGHNQVFLNPINTLYNLYLNPLYQFLSYSNPQFLTKDNSNPLVETKNSKHGIYYNSPETPLYFWLDFKTDPNETYLALKPYLQPFIDQDYLAYYDTETKTFNPGPIIITITGNLPIELIEQEKKRYVFIDAPLKLFKANTDIDKLKKYSELSVVASSSLHELLGDEEYATAKTKDFNFNQRRELFKYFDLAHKFNLKTRVWGGVNWPNYLRNLHLKSLFELGCDLLNVDNLKDASEIF